MPTLNKLEYLDETKEQIKDALNTNFNSGITDEDTFRSYVGKIDDIYTNWAKVTGEGTELTLSNVKKGRMPLQPKGNTEQTTYSGKNLCSSAKLQSAANIRFYIDKKIEKTLTISFTTNESLNTNSLYLSATDTLATTITADANTKATATFTLSDEQYNAIQGATNPYFLLFKSGANFTIPTDAQIENGSTATDYEPYVGGTPSPNPDYPQDVKVVENKQVVNVHGKNLFNPSNVILHREISSGVITYSANSNMYYMKVNIGAKYNFSRKSSAKNGIIGFADEIPNTGVIIYDRTNLSNITSVSKTATHKYLILQLHQDEDLSETMVEVGNTKTTYEPYHNQDYEIDLGDIELCKIGDYKDKIYKENDKWYLHKEIGKHTINENDDVKIGSPSTDGYARCGWGLSSEIMTADFTKVMVVCDKFIGVPQNDNTPSATGKMWCCSVSNTDQYKIMFRVGDNTITGADFSTFIKNNNVTVYYVLTTPTNTEITNETLITQLEALNNAMSFDGTNNISSEYATGNAPVIISASALMKGGN